MYQTCDSVKYFGHIRFKVQITIQRRKLSVRLPGPVSRSEGHSELTGTLVFVGFESTYKHTAFKHTGLALALQNRNSSSAAKLTSHPGFTRACCAAARLSASGKL